MLKTLDSKDINLGLVCQTHSDLVKFKHLTKSRFDSLNKIDKLKTLKQIYEYNLSKFIRAYEFCLDQNILLYRVYSNMFPFWDTNLGQNLLSNEYKDDLKAIGQNFMAKNIRLVTHPEQYVVLNSDSDTIIQNSIKILAAHSLLFNLLDQPKNAYAAIIVHGGKGGSPDKLINMINNLPIDIRSRLVLENDEICYSASEMLKICLKAKIPMVFDAHHHVCKEKLDSFNDDSITYYLDKAGQTWSPNTDWQLVHISNGASHFNDRKHSDLINDMPDSYRRVKWIEVEAKHKELALEHLRTSWLKLAHR